jgi:predicted Zn-dependent protease
MKGLRTITTARVAVAFIAMALLASSALAQSRGSARLSGKVVDEQGQPVEGVAVKAQMSGQTEIMSGRSDKKGEWRINGLANGEWKVELTKPELGTVSEMVEIRGNDAPALNVTLKKAAAKVDPRAEVDAELKRAADLAQGGKLADARKIYEDLLVKYPDIYQLEGFIARTYAAENNTPAALQHLKVNLEKEPDNVDLKLLQADLLMESGDKAAAKTILDSVDITKAKDPYTFINEAIILVNDKKGPEAVDLLTKLMAQFPTANELYYYRGRAYVVSEKLDEARADLEKFVTLAPAAKETADAKKILEQIKK